MKLLPKILPQNEEQRRAQAYRAILRYEAKLGGQLFGAVPKGHRREFFCLDRYTWIWHEEWIDAQGQKQVVSTRYTVRPSGILKSQNNGGYQQIGAAELRNFHHAVKLYSERVPAALQRQLQAA